MLTDHIVAYTEFIKELMIHQLILIVTVLT
jgi:hypothetical protein